jgi:hypothetical protein
MERAADAYTLSENDRDKPFKLDQVPYAHYVRRLDDYLFNSKPSSIPPAEIMQHLQQVYLSLLDIMLDGLRSLPEGTLPEDPNAIKLGKGLSYNLLMTKKHMHIIPRREKVYKMPVPKAKGEETPKASTEPAIIGCNALAYTVPFQHRSLAVKSMSADCAFIAGHGPRQVQDRRKASRKYRRRHRST